MERAILTFTDLDKNKVFLRSGVFKLIPHSSVQPFDSSQIHDVGTKQAGKHPKSQWGTTTKTDSATKGERYLLINLPDRNKATTCNLAQALILF